MGKKQFCFFQTAETGNRTPDSGVKGSGANHYPRAPARLVLNTVSNFHPLEVVGRGSETQLYVGENLYNLNLIALSSSQKSLLV